MKVSTVLLCGGIALAGCTTVPSLNVPTPISVPAVVQRIQCDLKQVVIDYPIVSSWHIQYDLNLVIDETLAAAPSVVVISPYSGGLFNFGIGVKASSEATRTEKLTVKELFRDLKTLACGDLVDGVLLESNLKISEWVGEILRLKSIRQKDIDTIGHSVKFQILAGLNINPTLVLTRFLGPGAGVDPLVSGTVQNTNELVLSLTEGKTGGAVAAASRLDRSQTNQYIQQIAPSLVPFIRR